MTAPRLAVCIPTFRRPAGLARLLASLADTAPAVPGELRPVLVVIDNDEQATARSVVEDRRADLPWPVLYEVEPRQGLSSVRNRAISVALDAGASLVAFIDDDEVAGPGWPSELVRVHRETGAPIVTGPVASRFEREPAPWIVEGGFFDLPVHPDRAELHYAITGNVLIDESVLRSLAPAFDPDYDLSGGEDTHFFERARAAGHRIVWAADAMAEEIVVPERANLRWILRRELRRGTTLSLVLRGGSPSAARIAKRLAAVAVHLVRGIALLLVSPVRGRACAARGLHSLAFATGLLTGLFGHRPRHYEATTGAGGRRRRR